MHRKPKVGPVGNSLSNWSFFEYFPSMCRDSLMYIEIPPSWRMEWRSKLKAVKGAFNYFLVDAVASTAAETLLNTKPHKVRPLGLHRYS